MAELHCGVDFGTSNSTVAVAAREQRACLLPLEGESVTLPSAIFFSFEEDRRYFGRAALGAYIEGADGRLMRSLKSVLGTALFSDVTRIKQRTVTFSEILGTFIGEMRRRAEQETGAPIERVVLGRPVRFVDDDKVADAEAQGQLEAAARAQGLRHIEFQFEPIAAALDYEQQVSREEIALVVDIGGGTSDFSVVRVSPERARAADRRDDILSTAGVHVGGTDFDRLLSLGKVMPHLGYRTVTADGKRVLPAAPYYDLATWHRINRLYTQKTLLDLRSTRREAAHPEKVGMLIALIGEREGHRLAGFIEDAKIALTEHSDTQFRFPFHDGVIEAPMSQADLAELLASAVDRIDRTIMSALEMARIAPDKIDTLILTGGSTQVPAVYSRVRALCPRANAVSTDAFGSVGLGLALDARRRFA